MTDFTGIPRAFDVREAKRAREEEARKREQATSARNTSSTTIGSGGRLDVDGGDLTILNGGNAAVKDGGSFLVQGGGSMDIVDDGELTVTGQGIAPFTDEPTISKLKFGNRIALHTWTGYEFLQPGIYLEGEEAEPLLDTPRLTGVINGDGLITRSGRRQSEGRPANIKEQSSSMCTPWAATMGTLRYDSLINSDGEDGLAGREVDSSFSTMPGVATGMVEDVLNQRAYSLNLSADAAMATSGKTGAILSIASWHMSPASGWIRVDDGGLIDIQATLGAKTVGITSLVAGKLQLSATDGVNVQGAFTVNGSPVGGAVTSVAGKTGDVTLVKGDIGLGNVDNTSDANKPISSLTATALGGKASTAVATTSANGLMAFADKVKLDTLDAANTSKQALTPLQPTGWRVEGDIFIEQFGSVTRISMSVRCVRTGAPITAPAGTFQNLGAVIPVAARSTTGVQTYNPAWLTGVTPYTLGTIFANPSSGELLFNPSASITFGTNWGFTLAHTWSK